MTLGEKAYQYARRIFSSESFVKVAEDAYIAGATEALESQWKDPEVELPEVGEWVDVCICRKNNTIKYRYEARYEGNGIFEDNDGFKLDLLSYWMRIPEPPVKGGDAK